MEKNKLKKINLSIINKKSIGIYVVILVSLYIAIYVVPSVTGALVRTYTVEYGNLQVTDETTGYFVRTEDVYLATESGKENRYIEQGTLVRKGTTILEINGQAEGEIGEKYTPILTKLKGETKSSSDYISGMEGVVSYYADGYESTFTPSNMKDITYDMVEKISDIQVLSLKRTKVIKGEPVFKMVHNGRWYLVCFVDTVNKDRYQIDNQIEIGFNDDQITAKVHDVIAQGNKTMIILSTNRYYENFDRYRATDVTLITSDNSGLIVENSSIATKKGQQGVYVKNKMDEYVFTPISVITTDGEKSVAEKSYFYDENGEMVSTINTYDEILKSPK
ncbi:MAG: HlyD family efflux transporter periplasmic adaptor subunit [Anaerovoracaceae bacterium]